MTVLSLTLTVPRKSPHPSLYTFTDVIDPQWSAPNFVSLWQKYNHADTETHKDKPQEET